MTDLIDRSSRMWGGLAALGGVAIFLALELREDPAMSGLEIALELVEIIPIVIMAVGVVVLFRISSRQREEQLALMRDVEIARLQGQRWRDEARTFLNGLGEAIEAQFARWNLTEAEREVALLLLKGFSLKEIAALRATSERTIRSQARSLYAKAGITGRASLSAFFLEDLLAPANGGE
jgi:DNA-binding CsgD family transcriptional regulator